MMGLVMTEAMEEALMTDATQAASGVAGILNGAKIKPFVAPVTPTAKTLLSDLTVSIDANLAAAAVTWGTAYRRLGGGVAVDSSIKQFQLADADNHCSIYGIALLDSAGTGLLGCYMLANPYELADVLDALNLSIQFCEGGVDRGAVTVVS